MIPVNVGLLSHRSFTTSSARNKHFKEILYPIRHIYLFIPNKCISSELSSHFQSSFKDQWEFFPITNLHIQIFGMIEHMFRIFISRSYKILLPTIIRKHTISNMSFEGQPPFCPRHNSIFRNTDTHLWNRTSIPRKRQSPAT